MKDKKEPKGTILIVDNEPNMLWLMTKVFAPRGYGTFTAQTAEQAVKYFDSEIAKIDLMIIDVHMPAGMDGVEALTKIKARYSHLPVIVMSASLDRQEECEEIGIAKFIQKPFSLEDLYDCVELTLKGRIPREEETVLLPKNVRPYAKLLIVDDEPEVCRMISESLFEDFPEANFKVRAAYSGEEALSVSLEFEPDIAIVDIKMPGMSGDELIGRMKAGEGYCPRDFIIYTGVTEGPVIRKVQSLGHKVLTKPTNMETVYEVLKRICVRHHLLRKYE